MISSFQRLPDSEQPQCDCHATRIVRRLQSNGVEIYVKQCQECGANKGAVKKNSADILHVHTIGEWDETLQARWNERMHDYYDERRRRFNTQRLGSTEWWKQYNWYLETEAWKRLRARVLARDDYTCQGCGQRRATQVHHLTYIHVTQEFLFELVSVCDACHHRIHPDMDQS
jgi:5-methylcytosine-specific restriction endonuclease McrA